MPWENAVYPLIACLFFLAVGMMLPASFLLPDRVENLKTGNIAANYCVYRDAVVRYLDDHAGAVNIPAADLPLPPGYVALGNWQARIVGDRCYIFGTATSPAEFQTIRRRLGNSVLVGQNLGGVISPSGVVLPAGHGVPDGSIISLVSVR